MASPQPPKRRVRNESQLQQKRLADRTKHRENRKANKQSMQRVEHEIATIRRDLQALFSHIRTLQTVPTPLQPAIAYPVAIQDASRQLVPLGHPGHRIEDCQLQYGYSYAIQSQGFEGMPSPLTDATNPAVHISKHDQYGASGQVFDCHCGTRHSDLFGHIDHCVVTKLYKGRTTSRHDADALGDMPRNPSLSAMLLQSGNENTATFFITGFLKACPVKSVEQLLAFYLIAYRYMRWLMKPGEDTLRDVPPWMMPTEIQQSHPHPVVVDYLPWPSLRNYLCMSGDIDPRHSMRGYLESVRFLWSPEVPLMVQSATGEPILSPEFEVAASKLENWTMGPPWAEAFPHLMHLVRM